MRRGLDFGPSIRPDHGTYSIFLVHGVDGHPVRTWTHPNECCWPRDLLPVDLPRCRIVSLGYNADIPTLRKLPPDDISDHALGLLVAIKRLRADVRSRSSYRPLSALSTRAHLFPIQCRLQSGQFSSSRKILAVWWPRLLVTPSPPMSSARGSATDLGISDLEPGCWPRRPRRVRCLSDSRHRLHGNTPSQPGIHRFGTLLRLVPELTANRQDVETEMELSRRPLSRLFRCSAKSARDATGLILREQANASRDYGT